MCFSIWNVALSLVRMAEMCCKLPTSPPTSLPFTKFHQPLEPLVPTVRLNHCMLLLVPFEVKSCLRGGQRPHSRSWFHAVGTTYPLAIGKGKPPDVMTTGRKNQPHR